MARPAWAMSSGRSVVIDLTADDDDVPFLPSAQNRGSYPHAAASRPLGTLQPLPTSFDGLNPTDFTPRQTAQSRAGGAVSTFAQPYLGTRVTGTPHQALNHAHQGEGQNNKRTPQPNVPSQYISPNQAFAGQALNNRGSNAMNAGVKRRKLGGEASQYAGQSGRIAPAPTSGTPYNTVKPSTPASAIIPRSIIPQNKTVITGAHRAEASRIPNTSPQKPTVSANENEMVHVIEKQVLAHVHEAVRPFRTTLSHAERSFIGQKTASRLVSDPSFVENYSRNGKTLSLEYEKTLALKARKYVNEEVQTILHQRLDLDPAADPPAGVSSGTAQRSIERDHTESETSSDEEEIFEHSLPKVSQRAYSISPTTSYSNDHTDVEAGKPPHAHNAVGVEMTSSSARPMRAIAVKPDGTYKLRRGRKSKVEKLLEQQMLRQSTDAEILHTIRVQSECASASTSTADGDGFQTEPVSVKPKRRRRTRAQMIAARQLEAAEASGRMSPRTLPSATRWGEDKSSPFADGSSAETSTGARSVPYPAVARSQPRRVPETFYKFQRKATAPEDHFLLPYISHADRKNLRRQLSRPGIMQHLSKVELDLLKSSDLHVDFSSEETLLLCKFIAHKLGVSNSSHSDPAIQVMTIMKNRESMIPKLVDSLQTSGREWSNLLRIRSRAAIKTYLTDAANWLVAGSSSLTVTASKTFDSPDNVLALLREREIYGMDPSRTRNGRNSCKVLLRSHLEDALIRQSEWTDCSGDISSITWTGSDSFICGALAHSDSHNMQYNKPGNLLVGSTSKDTLRAYADHRIIRPLVAKQDNEENALDSMRTTQAPWLYTSVVSTAYCEVNGYAFTASFDGSIKVWAVAEDGTSMDLRGTWMHDGKVNFVVTSPYHDRVAAAFETNSNAVRIYNFDESAISESPYDEYCGNKTLGQADELRRRQNWAYQPATMQWGKALGVSHLLLVGYSPRSNSGDEYDIPEEKRNSGELCLWNSEDSSQVLISSAKTQNVFEVIWHPTQPIFLAATSPCGTWDSDRTRTQVRLFAQTEHGTFTVIKTLDCPALDVNELTVMPNSSIECFVTASCTDGFTYVWDTIRGDQPIHILQHGDSLDNPDPHLPKEVGDSGVKFACWGKSADRFYTGGSDGIIKAWNLKAPHGKAFVRNVLSISGGISTGVFNEDCSKLLVGDATGKVYHLSIDDSDITDDATTSGTSTRQLVAAGSQLSSVIKRPKVAIAHAEPAPPPNYDIMEDIEQSAAEIAHVYLERDQLAMYPNTEHPNSQRAVFQSKAYLETGTFDLESHHDMNASLELLPHILAKQQFVVDEANKDNRALRLPRLPKVDAADPQQHARNTDVDFDFAKLSLETQHELAREKVELDWDGHTFEYEQCSGRFRMFKMAKGKDRK